MSRYQEAQKIYKEAFGVDTEAALAKLADTMVSIHCWQGDDVVGFDSRNALSGGIQTTGNYPGKATTPEQLMADFEFACKFIPGKKKINLHASYAIWGEDETPDRSKIEPRHFAPWVEFAKAHGMGIDFNPTFFSHHMVKDNLTLSSPDKEVRDYWIEHGKRCIRVAQYFAQETGIPCVVNYWMPDGFKDFPADRTAPRARMAAALDEIFAEPYDKTMVYPTLESKVFGIGLEANTVGSAEFCLSYSAAHGITPLIDNGHYHPMETVGDKISSLLLFNDKLATHLTRPMRWDSDHVVLFDDDMRLIAQELVRNGLDRVFLATDFFDASINRVSAWITGLRNVHKALLYALLEPTDMMRKLQDENRMTELMVVHEDLKTAPLGDVWDEYLRREGIESNYIAPVLAYEKEILEERK